MATLLNKVQDHFHEQPKDTQAVCFCAWNEEGQAGRSPPTTHISAQQDLLSSLFSLLSVCSACYWQTNQTLEKFLQGYTLAAKDSQFHCMEKAPTTSRSFTGTRCQPQEELVNHPDAPTSQDFRCTLKKKHKKIKVIHRTLDRSCRWELVGCDPQVRICATPHPVLARTHELEHSIQKSAFLSALWNNPPIILTNLEAPMTSRTCFENWGRNIDPKRPFTSSSFMGQQSPHFSHPSNHHSVTLWAKNSLCAVTSSYLPAATATLLSPNLWTPNT